MQDTSTLFSFIYDNQKLSRRLEKILYAATFEDPDLYDIGMQVRILLREVNHMVVEDLKNDR